MKAISLKTEYRRDPLGIETRKPVFTWKCADGAKQVAYRLCAVDEAGRVLFDSGRVESSRMCCAYTGKPLDSMKRILWNVTLWDENDQGPVSENAWFETGLSSEDWQAKWICGVDTAKRERLPADYYRKVFTLDEIPQSARLYATAHGMYATFLNGERLPGVLAPGCTEYEKHLYYQTYDVTALLKSGENTLEFVVGDGWYKGKLGSTNNEYFFGEQTALLAQLVLTDQNGQRTVIGTDDSFLWCNDGPIIYTDLKDGEIYDARKTPSYRANAQLADIVDLPMSSPADGIGEHETFIPELLISPSGTKILDFGQNLAGYIRFSIHGKLGQTVRLRMCETLDHGEYSNNTLLHVLPDMPSTNQEIVYTCAGGLEWFQPEFFYSGFRYALVEGLDEVDPRDFEAVAVYSDLDIVGDFQCSNEKINQYLRNTRWSLKSNYVDIPTDCPQREKSGWTGDAQVFIKTASFLADTAAFYRKWLRDVRDCQREDGRVDNVCPKIRGVDNRDVLNGASGWADAAIIIPYTLWKLYGDDRFITENYELMHGWKEYAIKSAADKSLYHLPDGHPLKGRIEAFLLPDSPHNQYIIESGLHWGEWCEPEGDPHKDLILPKQELTAAYLHYSMRLLAEMLEAVGKSEEAAQCSDYAQGAKAAYNHYYVKDGRINAPRQAPMVRALALGLLSEEDSITVAAQLDADAARREYKVGTGFLSTPFVLSMLAKYGYVDTAYRMLENTEAPGWLAMVEQGATTVWEEYTAYDEKGSPLRRSMNHYSPGAVCGFLFETVCGIQVAGENQFAIAPVPGGTLTHARAEYDSPYGRVTSKWERTVEETRFTFEVPANTTAEIRLPDGRTETAGWGTHQYICKENRRGL